ncbi:flagellar basal body-associated protein FliL [Gallaecimonas xiamenensis]|uniref:Flagellar protein FliL n=1 Tax=Gallaecimonas xiamenensis 3-C-1 TaxID=745411 RepID=K2JYK0_9GAMM|nr:flagellar basal body-associated protein FliL [Gallaecimonas xiamenensis]EKE75414.1 flagellar basal body-associated protein FliL [Gallaecimonas xiamenensis 3-C-1]
MAQELELEPLDAAKGGKKKLIIIIVAALLVLGIGGGVAAWLLSGDTAPAEAETAEAAPAPSEGEALYVALPQPFVFNVPGDKRPRLVQITVQVMVRGQTNEGKVKQHLPLVESVLLQTFSQFSEDQLATSQGRETLRTTAQQAVDDALTQVTGSQVIERVLFTGFIMQ